MHSQLKSMVSLQKKLKSYLAPIDRSHLKRALSPIDSLHPGYMYGLLGGAILTFTLIMRFKGFNSLLGLHQIHNVTITWLLVMWLWYFHHLESRPLSSRIVISFFFMFFLFEVHDLFWLWDAHRGGILFEGFPLFYPDANYLWQFLPRGLFCLGVSLVWIYKSVRISKYLILLLVPVAYHTVFVPYVPIVNLIPEYHFIVTQLCDTVPWLFIVKQPTKPQQFWGVLG